MKTPPPSRELEAWLAPSRTIVRLPPSIEARAIARARAAAALPEPRASRVSVGPRWLVAAAAGAVLVVGAAAYATHAWHDWIDRSSAPAEDELASDAPPLMVVPRPPAAAPAPEAAETVAAEPRTARRALKKTSAAPAPPTSAELQLLRAARNDVTRGDFAGALSVLAEHARRFRHGSLVEEREALRVKSLAGLGRHEDAQRAAAAFHARFPHSVFLSTFGRMKETGR